MTATAAGDRARYIHDRVEGVHVDTTLAWLDLSHLARDFDRGGGRVLVREVEFDVVAHVPLWRDVGPNVGDVGWFLPSCGVDAIRHSWSGNEPWDRWVLVDGPVAAMFARHCRRCMWGRP